jgi:membrane carboxypeptidase/penicillin-binding protein
LAVWNGFADRVAANVPAAGFTRPPGVHFSLMNRYTGRVTTADRDDAVMAAFADGTGPKQP